MEEYKRTHEQEEHRSTRTQHKNGSRRGTAPCANEAKQRQVQVIKCASNALHIATPMRCGQLSHDGALQKKNGPTHRLGDCLQGNNSRILLFYRVYSNPCGSHAYRPTKSTAGVIVIKRLGRVLTSSTTTTSTLRRCRIHPLL